MVRPIHVGKLVPHWCNLALGFFTFKRLALSSFAFEMDAISILEGACLVHIENIMQLLVKKHCLQSSNLTSRSFCQHQRSSLPMQDMNSDFVCTLEAMQPSIQICKVPNLHPLWTSNSWIFLALIAWSNSHKCAQTKYTTPLGTPPTYLGFFLNLIPLNLSLQATSKDGSNILEYMIIYGCQDIR